MRTQTRREADGQQQQRRRQWCSASSLWLFLSLLLLFVGSCAPVSAQNQACTKCETSNELAVCAGMISENEPVFLTREACQGGSSATARVNSIVDGADSTSTYRGGTDNCRDLTIQIMCTYIKVATTGFKFDTCDVKAMCQKDCEVVKACQIDPGSVNCKNDSPLVVDDSLSEDQTGWPSCPKLAITPVRKGGKGTDAAEPMLFCCRQQSLHPPASA